MDDSHFYWSGLYIVSTSNKKYLFIVDSDGNKHLNLPDHPHQVWASTLKKVESKVKVIPTIKLWPCQLFDFGENLHFMDGLPEEIHAPLTTLIAISVS